MKTYELSIKDKEYKIKVKSFSLDHAELEIDGEVINVDVKSVGDLSGPKPIQPKAPTAASPSAAPTSAPKAKAPVGGGDGTAVVAPIPGAIMEVFVKVGDDVAKGQPVLKMEAMKMENVINADVDGKILTVNVNPGEAVSQGEELVTIG